MVMSEFNEELTTKMLASAKNEVKIQGAELGEIISVPGAYDIPLAAKKLLMFKENDGIVAIGAVVKGDTKHDEVITQSTATVLAQLSLQFNKPITLGIIGPGATWEQAEERAEEYAKNAIKSSINLVKKLRR
ncbi:MAG: 6,7-dimethyl-8-ribityllumazine synthase [Candidatus Micrarchaeota archaeon]|nr:6,7-dimethyl-8-ribityllumazine synthase [Candidatus Micrarchaeota archaeon]